ncbi:MAG: site-specific integrase [bacterium]
MKLTIRFYLREDVARKDNNFPIYLDARVNTKRITFSTGLYTKKTYWNENKCEVKSHDPWHVRINKRLAKLRRRIAEIEDDCIAESKTISARQFKTLLLNTSGSSSCFFEYMETKLNQRKEILKPQTINTNKNQIDKLKEFQAEISFGDLDYDLIKRYEAFLIVKRKNIPSTVSKSMTFLKLMINEAIKDGRYKGLSPFVHYKIQRHEGKREYLEEEEVEKLEKLYKNNTLSKGKQNVLTYFLFCCYTGIRYGDVKELKLSDIHENKKGRYINILTEKTDKAINVPLIPKALALIPEGLLKNQKVFNVYTDQPTNRYLKAIAEEAGINKKISFHVSRHTFATLSGLYGIPIEIVKDLLGHSDIKTTLLYRKTTNKQLWSEMGKWDKGEQAEEANKTEDT